MPGGSGGMSGSGGDAGTDPSCPDGCFIDGACFEANEENPDDSCQVCLPAKKASGWSTSAACCTEEDEPVSFGCDGTRVVGLNACDDVVSTEEDCADLPNRACRAGACACAPGRTGDDCEQPVLYVRPDGDDEASGTSWDEAFATVGAALARAAAQTAESAPGELAPEIWVAEGTYTPPPQTDTPRAATFQLVPGVALYGGFAGIETARDQRDFQTNVTVLSGEIGDPADVEDNVYHVVTGASGATLDGFTVTGGYSQGGGSGAGMLNVGVTVTVANCVFRGNQAPSAFGAAMYNTSEAVVTVIDSLFTENDAANGGGAVHTLNAEIIVQGSTFSKNVGLNHGGALYNWNAKATVSNSTFSENRSTNGGAMSNRNSQVVVRNSTFSKNEGRFGTGGAIYNGNSADVTVVDAVFDQNEASYGGAVGTNQSQVLIVGATFTQNKGVTQGGAMHNQNAGATVFDAIFSKNTSPYGGGMYNRDASEVTVMNGLFVGNTATNTGGAMHNAAGKVALLHTLVAHNSTGLESFNTATVSLLNSIVWGNTSTPLAHEDPALVTVASSILEGDCPAGASCDDVVDADPRFLDPDEGDFRLAPGSPAIDAGDASALPSDEFDRDDDEDTTESHPFDLAGHARIVGSKPDLGPYEASCEDTPGVLSGIAPECAPASCEALFSAHPDFPSGTYWLSPDGDTSERTYCAADD